MTRPPKIEERSEEIMRAFELCVARRGLAATTLAEVAAEAGLPRSLVRYFMGNRDEMVDRLIERLVTRAEASLSRVRDAAGDASLEALLDLFFSEVFANTLSNSVMSELWHLSENDEHVRERLQGVYDRAMRILERPMELEGLGRSGDERRSAAFAIVSLAVGASDLNDFGLSPPDPRAMRKAADLIAAGLQQTAKASRT